LPKSPEEEGHNPAHRPTWDRLERKIGTAQVGGVERTLAWLGKYRRLAVRYERRVDIHEAFLHLGCSLICLNYLR
jgi:transposase